MSVILDQINQTIADEQTALDAATTDEERAEHQRCLEHFNGLKDKVEASYAAGGTDEDAEDVLLTAALDSIFNSILGGLGADEEEDVDAR